MKLTNLLLSGLVALSFTACSSSDDEPNVPSAETDGTTIEVSANVINTKATADNYTVIVYNANGTFEASGAVDSKIAIKEGDKTIIVVRGSKYTVPTSGTLSDLKAATIAYDGVVESDDAKNTQNSCIYQCTATRGKVNMIGFTDAKIAEMTDGVRATYTSNVFLTEAQSLKIPVYRNVANINLTKVAVQTKSVSTDEGSVNVYSDPKVTINKVFIVNARANTLAIPAANGWWQNVEKADGAYVNGLSVEDFSAAVTDATIADKFVNKLILAQTTTSYDATLVKAQTDASATQGDDKAWKPKAVPSFFIYENMTAENPTLLVIGGSFSYTNAENQTITEDNRYWAVKVGEDVKTTSWTNYADFGLTTPADIKGVRRNIQYNIDVTITGPGSSNPIATGENTYIDANVQLVDWGKVDQSGTID